MEFKMRSIEMRKPLLPGFKVQERLVTRKVSLPKGLDASPFMELMQLGGAYRIMHSIFNADLSVSPKLAFQQATAKTDLKGRFREALKLHAEALSSSHNLVKEWLNMGPGRAFRQITGREVVSQVSRYFTPWHLNFMVDGKTYERVVGTEQKTYFTTSELGRTLVSGDLAKSELGSLVGISNLDFGLDKAAETARHESQHSRLDHLPMGVSGSQRTGPITLLQLREKLFKNPNLGGGQLENMELRAELGALSEFRVMMAMSSANDKPDFLEDRLMSYNPGKAVALFTPVRTFKDVFKRKTSNDRKVDNLTLEFVRRNSSIAHALEAHPLRIVEELLWTTDYPDIAQQMQALAEATITDD